MSVKERLKEFIKYSGLKINEFEKEIGVSNGYVNSITKGIGNDKMTLILERFSNLNPEWLLTGNGEIEKEKIYPEKNLDDTFPLLAMEAFAGYGDTIAAGEEIGRIEEHYEVPLFRGLNIDFMIQVNGSSMYPKYNSGDVVACRIIEALTFIQWGKVYVIDTISQGVILKRLKPSKDENVVICKSDNENYDPFKLPKSEIRKIALVLGVIRLE